MLPSFTVRICHSGECHEPHKIESTCAIRSWDAGRIQQQCVHVDDGGQIVGASITGTPDPHSFLGESVHPFIWQNGVMQDLGTLQEIETH